MPVALHASVLSSIPNGCGLRFALDALPSGEFPRTTEPTEHRLVNTQPPLGVDCLLECHLDLVRELLCLEEAIRSSAANNQPTWAARLRSGASNCGQVGNPTRSSWLSCSLPCRWTHRRFSGNHHMNQVSLGLDSYSQEGGGWESPPRASKWFASSLCPWVFWMRLTAFHLHFCSWSSA
jgi:hypothetical protein